MATRDWRDQTIHRTLPDLNRVLLETGRLSDVTFLIGPKKETFLAHSFILATRSSVFEIMFSDAWNPGGERQDGNFTVELPDAHPESFRGFLNFLYTDTTDGLSSPIEVLYLGKKYDIPEVIRACVAYLTMSIRIATVVGIYEAARLFDLRDLGGAAMKYMLKHATTLTQHPDFLNLDVDTLTELLSSDSLQLPEVAVFQSLLAWGRAECERQDKPPTPPHLRGVIERFLPLVRFPIMSPQDFTMEVVPTDILSSTEVIQLFVQFNSGGGEKEDGVPALPFNTTPRLLQISKFAAWRNGKLPIRNSTVGVYLSNEACSPVGLSYTLNGDFGKLHEESLDFTVSRTVEIVGVGLYGPDPDRLLHAKHFKTYSVDIQLFTYPNPSRTYHLRAFVTRTSLSVSTRADYDCHFDRPVTVSKDTLHHVRIGFKGQETRHGISRLSNVSTICNDEKVTFNFLGPITSPTCQPEGRIRCLIFNIL